MEGTDDAHGSSLPRSDRKVHLDVLPRTICQRRYPDPLGKQLATDMNRLLWRLDWPSNSLT